jgi:hypothetical protein
VVDQRLEVVHGQIQGPLPGLAVGGEPRLHERHCVPLGPEEPPDVCGVPAWPPEIEDRIARSHSLVFHALSPLVDRRPRHREPVGREHARAQRSLARKRSHVPEPRPVIDADPVAIDRQPGPKRDADGVQELLRLVVDPDDAGLGEVGPGFEERARREGASTLRDLRCDVDQVDQGHRARE